MSVVKLNEYYFPKIETNITKYNNLPSKIMKTCTNNIFKYFDDYEDKQNIVWVQDHVDDVLEMMHERKATNYWSIGTYRIYYEALANILLAIDKNKNKEICTEIFMKAKDCRALEQIEIEKQTLSKKQLENFITYDEIGKSYINYYLPRFESLKDHYRFLILALNYHIPPMRNNFNNLNVISFKPPNDDENYLQKTESDYILHLRKDKCTKNKGPVEINLTEDLYCNSTGRKIIDGSMLNVVLNNSFQYFPRNYLLSSTLNINTPMSLSSFNHILSCMFGAKTITQNSFRKAFVNHWYADANGLSIGEKKKIAKRMRHTTTTAECYYKKVNIPKPDTKYRKANKTLSLEYYHKNKMTVNRANTIKRYNSDPDLKPRRKTIEKYNLIFLNGKWK